MGNAVEHEVKVLRTATERRTITTHNLDKHALYAYIYYDIVDDPRATGDVLSIEIDGETFSVERLRNEVGAE